MYRTCVGIALREMAATPPSMAIRLGANGRAELGFLGIRFGRYENSWRMGIFKRMLPLDMA